MAHGGSAPEAGSLRRGPRPLGTTRGRPVRPVQRSRTLMPLRETVCRLAMGVVLEGRRRFGLFAQPKRLQRRRAIWSYDLRCFRRQHQAPAAATPVRLPQRVRLRLPRPAAEGSHSDRRQRRRRPRSGRHVEAADAVILRTPHAAPSAPPIPETAASERPDRPGAPGRRLMRALRRQTLDGALIVLMTLQSTVPAAGLTSGCKRC